MPPDDWEKMTLSNAFFYFPRVRIAWKIVAAGAVFVGMLLGVCSAARAGAPMAKIQSPGYYRMKLGRFEITALHDGVLVLNADVLRGASPEDVKTLLAKRFIDYPTMPTSVNAFLVNAGEKLALVDAGSGRAFGPSLGRVVENLRA